MKNINKNYLKMRIMALKSKKIYLKKVLKVKETVFLQQKLILEVVLLPRNRKKN